MNNEQKVTEVETKGRSERSRIVYVLSSTVNHLAEEGRKRCIDKNRGGCWEEQSTNGYVWCLYLSLSILRSLAFCSSCVCRVISGDATRGVFLHLCSRPQKEREGEHFVQERVWTYLFVPEFEISKQIEAHPRVPLNWHLLGGLSSLVMIPSNTHTHTHLYFLEV